MCEPVVFSNGHINPKTIALDDDLAYLAVYGHACPPSGSGGATGNGHLVRAHRVNGSQSVDIDELPCPIGVAVEGDDVYVTTQPGGAAGGSILTAKKNGENLRVFVDDLHYPGTVHADATHVYFSDTDGIYRVAREGGGAPELLASAENVPRNIVNAFVLDEDFVYWINPGFPEYGGVLRTPKAGGDPEPVAPVRDAIEIAISDAGLFWVVEKSVDEFVVVFLEWNAEMPIEIATPSARPHSLSAWEDQAYWVVVRDSSAGGVYGVSARTGESIFFLPDVSLPQAVNVDRDYIFWTMHSPEGGYNGQLMRACRPGSR